MTGIYKITCLVNHKIYIGQSVRLQNRLSTHQRELKQGIHFNMELQKDFDLYGVDNFTFEIIEQCPATKLDERERFYIKLLNAQDTQYGYNLTEGGCECRGTNNPMYGKSGKLSPRFIDIIYQLDISGAILAEFESANLAAKAINGQAGHINDCLQTWKQHSASPVGASHPERLTHKGYQWIFKKDYEILKQNGYDFSKKRTKKSLTIQDLIDKGALSSNT